MCCTFFGNFGNIHVKNQWKVMSDFRKIKMHYSPPLLSKLTKNAPTFFLLVGYCRTKFWWKKNIHFVYFPKKFLSLSVSHDFFAILVKICHFLRKIAYFGGKQTNSKIFEKMKSLKPGDSFSYRKCYNISKTDHLVLTESWVSQLQNFF